MEYTVQKIMLALLKNAIDGSVLTDDQKAQIDENAAERLYVLSAKHDLAHIVGYSLKKQGIKVSDKIALAFEKQIMLAVFRDEGMSFAIAELSAFLEEEGADFVLLKGSVLKKYYPEKWMRTNCDIDLLVRKTEMDCITKLVCEKLNYTPKGRTSHDVSFAAPNGVSVEIHFDLVEEDIHPEGKGLADRVWLSVRPKEGYKHNLEMSDAAMYCYHLTHMAKHFREGGCGVRSFIDLWLLSNIDTAMPEEREKMIAESGLVDFENATRTVAKVWFEGGEHSSLSGYVEEYILNGGVYGSYENRVYSQQTRQGGKLKYLWKRTFLPMESLKNRYPVVRKYPILAPIYQFERFFTMVREKRLGKAVEEFKVNAKMSKEKIESGADLIKKLGL
ncbi:MAG: nucleotidyltransferase family protein [Clostridia bacterium]|nr:nucleotidyltransferase family protein [Clostridia bacterium]